MKRIVKKAAVLFGALTLLSSCTGGTEPEPPQTTEATEKTEATNEMTDSEWILAGAGADVPFALVFDTTQNENSRADILQLREAMVYYYDSVPELLDDIAGKPMAREIVFNSKKRQETAPLLAELGEGEYRITALSDGQTQKLAVVWKGDAARMCAIDRLLSCYFGPDRAAVPADLDIRDTAGEQSLLTVSKIPQLRDPCVLVGDDGTYYAYGTGWVYWKNTSGKLSGEWTGPFSCVAAPADAAADHWAPEVHRYNGAYYMITTYRSAATGHRGCTVMKADGLEGPFREISDGQITPRDWDSIDGTLYIDTDGTPWMVFVHEWTSTPDGVGRMAAARLSPDLTRFETEPVELFRADDPAWAHGKITDGCWMHRTQTGELLMLWSNSDAYGYCVGIARSSDGTLTGRWKQDNRRLYSRGLADVYDGGHGMIFTDTDGQMYLSVHSPNSSSAGRAETPVFVRIREDHGTLVWDAWDK